MKHPLHYLGLALMGAVIGASCMYIALRELDLGMTTLLEKLQPLLVFVFASIFLKEKFPVHKIHWIILALGSSYFLIAPEPFNLSFKQLNLIGLLGIFGAATSWALATVIGKQVSDQSVPAEHIVFFRFFIAIVFLLPVYFFHQSLGLIVHWSPKLIAIIIVVALFSSALGYYLFYRGLKTVAAGLSAMQELVTPLTGIVLGVAFLGERLTSLQWIAAVLLLLSVYSLTKPDRA